jgi:sec-independent protein translocase protein TatC
LSRLRSCKNPPAPSEKTFQSIARRIRLETRIGSSMSREGPSPEKAGTIFEHLNELASRLKIVLISLFLTTTFFMVFPSNSSFLRNPLAFYDPLIALVLRQVVSDVLPAGIQLIAGEFTAPLEIYLIASVLLGVAVSAPVIAYEVYRYIDPALYAEERRAIYPFVGSFTILFLIGAVFGYKVLAPFMLWAMLPFFKLTGAVPIIYVMDFYSLVFITTLTSGFSFTMPVFFVLLVRFGILKTSYITTRRRYVYAALYIITAVITPDGGPIADLALFVPMAILLELAVFFGKRYERKGKVEYRPSMDKSAYVKCKFCGALLNDPLGFCPACDKAQL